MQGQDLLSELKASGYKYSEDDLIFIAHDRSGQLIWLEKGNESAGLTHIIERHAVDFQNAHGVDKEGIAELLYRIVTNGTVVSNRLSINGQGFDRVYDYDDTYYTFTGIGSNGFIVTAFPVGK